jgi:hypothetical protein
MKCHLLTAALSVSACGHSFEMPMPKIPRRQPVVFYRNHSMRTFFLLPICAVALLVSGCASPRGTYVSQHPELPQDHRRILLAGTLKYGDLVEGMTKEEIRLTMGKPPTKTEMIEGEEAWIWVRVKEQAGRPDPWDATSVDSVDAGAGQTGRRKGNMAAPKGREIKTTVFFHGDIANRLQIDEDTL